MARKSRARAEARGRRIGYARVSTKDQNLALQIDALKRMGCEIIFKDQGISGLTNRRPGLDKAIAALERGSDFVIWKIDRLGRDVEHLNRAAREFREQGIALQSVCEHIDLETPEGRLNFRIKAAYAEYERDLISIRTKAGMAAAKARGQVLGRPRKLSKARITKARQMLSREGETVKAVARTFGVAPLKIRCEQRVENNERRRKKQWVKDQFSQRAGDFHRWQRLRLQEAFMRQEKDKEDLSAAHKTQRQKLFADKEQQIKKADAQIRDRHRDRWRIIYQDQDEKRQRLRDAQKSVFAKVKYFLKEARSYLHAPKEQRSGFLRGIFTSVVGGPKQFAEMDKKHRELRSKVSSRIDEQRKAEFRKINAAYKGELTRLKDKQQAEKHAMAKRQAEESQQRAKAIKERADHEARRQQGFAKTLGGFRQAGREITNPQSKLARDFENAKDNTAHEDMRSRLRRKMSGQRVKEIQENAQDITKPKPSPSRDFNQARGAEPDRAADKNKNRSKDTYRAFRDLADEVTQNRSKGGGRSFTKKPPKGPEFR